MVAASLLNNPAISPPVRPNLVFPFREFPSPLRELYADVDFVRPDIIGDLTNVVIGGAPNVTYIDSVYYEIKALSSGRLAPGYQSHQIRGYIDHLSNGSPAGLATGSGSIPDLILITSSNVSEISFRTTALATINGVAVWHGWGCYESAQAITRTFATVSPQILKNGIVYVGLSVVIPTSRQGGLPVIFP
ncbi:MAG: hypothetical protein HC878_03265 [Leptolyngbyaceae cyanobacterium SL_5_14]|nr:hypothetical protein [Leptolyngbyaceae cyanobacterium SL_5_14]